MKKSLTIVSAFLLLLTAQTNTASAQAVEEGNIIIEGYYGFPNLYTSIFKTTYANSGTSTDLTIKGLGPVGGRVEYLLADKFGLGLDVGFNNTKISYKDQVTEFDSNTGNSVVKTYNYDFSTQKIGVMVTMNYHFIDNDALDLYGMFGVGYGNRSYSFKSNDPNYSEGKVDSPIPIASRLGIGMRYFFTDNLGVNLNLGVGQGGLMNAGISAKF